jgi:predicted nuclease of predicted toxin-antitoxin system
VKIKLDENLSRHLKDALSQLGHDVATAVEEGLLGKVDTEVGAAAKGEDRMIFTLDLDFADLRKFAPGSHPGVVLFRPRSMGHSRLIALS